MNAAKRSVALVRMCVRQSSSQSVGKPSSHFESLKRKQAKFQVNDGLPVYLKGGAIDKVLYQTTVVLCLVGTGFMTKLFWDLAVPK